MKTKNIVGLFIFLSVYIFILEGCSSQSDVNRISTLLQPSITPFPNLFPTEPTSPPEQLDELTPSPQAILVKIDSKNPLKSATPDLRPSAEEWQKWPIIPKISDRAVEIYRTGQRLGRDPHAFSIIGDCQSIPGVFMGKFGNKLGYYLKPGDEYLQETIDQYPGSFDRNGMAVQGGFTAPSLLSPIQANPDYCTPGETPLSCEFRVHNPSIVIISLETWRNPETIDRYEGYLQKIIEASIEKGILPILMTKADMAETGLKHVINPVLTKLAFQYDIPLANFWLAAQALENDGLDPQREGYHLSREGWNVKSYIGLQALDAVSTVVVKTKAPNSTKPNENLSPSPSPTPTSNVDIAQKFNPIGLNNCLNDEQAKCVIFSLSSSQDGLIHDKGIYLFDLANQNTEEIAGDGYRIQDISPDKNFILLSNANNLYLAKLSGPDLALISDHFFNLDNRAAAWLPDGQKIVVIKNIDGNNSLWLYDTKGNSWIQLSGGEDHPINLLQSNDPNAVIWQEGKCNQKHTCSSAGYWITRINGTPKEELSHVIQPSLSPDNQAIAFMDPIYNGEFGFNDKLAIESLSQRLPSRRLILFPHYTGYKIFNRINNFFWSPDSNQLLVLYDKYSKYYEQSTGYHVFVWNRTYGWMKEYNRVKGMLPGAAWSPENQSVLLYTTQQTPSGDYKLDFELINLNTGEQVNLKGNFTGQTQGYRFISNIYWLK